MMQLGAAWYPEHWPKERWVKDLELMKQAKFTVVRVAEFAWSSMEPEEGTYQFKWLDEAIDLAADFGMKTVMCTPTPTPPAWLTQKYPEVLRWDAPNAQARHGHRRHITPASQKYRDFSNQITKAMVDHFGQNPHVIGWQTDNEFSLMCYGEVSRRAFHAWLESKYGSLDALNEDWHTAYWSHTYSHWDQIPAGTSEQSPNLKFAYRRFFSDLYRDFQRDQVKIIKTGSPDHVWVTHNFCPYYEFDREVLSRDLDFCSWDAYMTETGLDPAVTGFEVDLIRGLKQKNIWIMETQPGFVNWKPPNMALAKGHTRKAAWHMIGHGADAVLYWQWRAPLGGHEVYHGSILGPHGEPRPVYEEIAQLGADFKKVGEVVEKTSPVAEVAMLHDQHNHWSIEDGNGRMHPEFKHLEINYEWYRCLREEGVTVDVVTCNAPLEKYKLIVCPHLHLIDEKIAQKLIDYVEQGGQLLLGPRSGFRDLNFKVLESYQPGPLVELLGGRVLEFYTIPTSCQIISDSFGEGKAETWGEMLEATHKDCEVLMTYGEHHGWLTGHPAMLRRQVKEGSMSYLGCVLDHVSLKKVIAEAVDRSKAIRPLGVPQQGIEVSVRNSESDELLLIYNHNNEAAAIQVPGGMTDLLTGNTHEANLVLAAHDFVVMKK